MSDALSRNTDPRTSAEAGRRAREFLSDHHQIILGVLWRGMTIFEIGKFSGLDPIAVGRRMHELLDAGKVRRREIGKTPEGEAIYETRPSPSGRQACVWEQVLETDAAKHAQPELFA